MEVKSSVDLRKIKELSKLHGSSVSGEGAGGLGIYLWQEKGCYCCGKITYQDEQRQLFSKKIDKKIKWNWNKNYEDMVVCAGCSQLIRKEFSNRIVKENN